MKGQTLTLPQALLWILGSVLLISGTACVIVHYSQKPSRSSPLTILIQTGPKKEALPTSYLAELLGLSADHPTQEEEFSLDKATQALLACPVIKAAKIFLPGSGVLYVDYTMREPIALLGDCVDAAFDAEGKIFPLSPFFSPKNLRKVYFGLKNVENWDLAIEEKKLRLACDLIDLLSAPELASSFFVSSIDVSHAEEKSLAKREIVLHFDDRIVRREGHLCIPRWIRLSPTHYEQELADFTHLRQHLIEQEKFMPAQVIDLRIKKMAFISKK
jgi:hypothetical protein